LHNALYLNVHICFSFYYAIKNNTFFSSGSLDLISALKIVLKLFIELIELSGRLETRFVSFLSSLPST